LALTTGARPSELLALRWSDCDVERQTITITRGLHHHRKGGGYSFAPPKPPKSLRSIPVSASTVAALKLHRAMQLEQRLKQGSDYQNLDLIFSTSIGTPLMQRNIISRHLEPILERAKLLKTITLYTLRHSCASLLLGSGENVKVISERLGHADVALTLNVYSHLQPGAQESATQRLEQTLFG
jgi:integrase